MCIDGSPKAMADKKDFVTVPKQKSGHEIANQLRQIEFATRVAWTAVPRVEWPPELSRDFRAQLSENLSIDDIIKEENAELRRIMVEAFGLERFIREAKGVPLAADECGELYRLDIGGANDEPMVVVKVRNSTPEPDGSYRDYFLRVPPFMLTARAAVAWTFGLKASEYEPEAQS